MKKLDKEKIGLITFGILFLVFVFYYNPIFGIFLFFIPVALYFLRHRIEKLINSVFGDIETFAVVIIIILIILSVVFGNGWGSN